MAALAMLVNIGFGYHEMIEATKNITGVPGRMELFTNIKASIIVDYAHTPDASKKALTSARQHTKNNLIVVFGCGGDRDKLKRPVMGKIANDYADFVYLTEDNSRNESPQQIVEEIKQGIETPEKIRIELNRKAAIKKALMESKPEDMILLAGKGHETYMEINNTRVNYDERGFVRYLLERQPVPDIQAHRGQHD